MIDLTNLEQSDYATTVRPSDNIFTELGLNTYDYKDLLSELIDNCIVARRPNVPLKVVIDIYVNINNKPLRFIIRDNASGIAEDRLGSAITPAGIQSINSLNEHGLGMKQAVAALGKLEYLATKTEGEVRARVIREFKFGDIITYYAPFEPDSGTEISITDIKTIVVTHTATITRSIIPYLGARYRRFLKPDSRILDLSINVRSIDKPDEIQYGWVVSEVKPIYFHPSTRTNQPVMLKFSVRGKGWKAALTFGYAPKHDDEYAELGIEPPSKFHPYKVSLSRQGLDIILHDRVILFHQLSELDIVGGRHPDYNDIRGEIDLLEGFTTAITKNSIIHDDNFKECVDKIQGILKGELKGPGDKKKDYLVRKTYPEQLPEKLLRDRLIEWLVNNPLSKRKDVKKEYVVEGVEGYIDILADEEAWEIKIDQANALDVYQLFMYMDVGKIDKGFLVAKSFTTGAEVAAQHIQKEHGKAIALAHRKQFPINQSPTDSEREEYY